MRFKPFQLSPKSNQNILLEANMIMFSVLDAVINTEAIQEECKRYMTQTFQQSSTVNVMLKSVRK